MSGVLSRLKRLFQLRFAVLYPLGIYLAFFTTPGDDSMRAGAIFMLVGIFMRLWSNGYAIKMGKLTTSGPYAFVRNPLYIGTAFIILGFIVMLEIFFVGAVFFALLAVVYARTIRQEQARLTEVFGAAYIDYCRHVPAMWPALRPYAAGEKWPFSFKRLWESREHKVFLWVGIIVIIFHLKEKILVENERFGIKIVALVLGACFLVFIDVLGECVRCRQKKV